MKKPKQSTNIYQVIQAVTCSSPIGGGHQQPFQKGHVNSPSQKGHQQNCQVGVAT